MLANENSVEFERGWSEGRAALRREMFARCVAGDQRMQEIMRTLYLDAPSPGAPAQAHDFLRVLIEQLSET